MFHLDGCLPVAFAIPAPTCSLCYPPRGPDAPLQSLTTATHASTELIITDRERAHVIQAIACSLKQARSYQTKKELSPAPSHASR